MELFHSSDERPRIYLYKQTKKSDGFPYFILSSWMYCTDGDEDMFVYIKTAKQTMNV